MPADTSSVTVEPGFSFTRAFGSCPMSDPAGTSELICGSSCGRSPALPRALIASPSLRPVTSGTATSVGTGGVVVVPVDVDVDVVDVEVVIVSGGVSDTATALPRGARVPASGTWRAIGVPAEPCAVTCPSCRPAARSFATARSTVSPTIVGTSRPARPTASVSVIVAPGATIVPASGDCAITLPGRGPLRRSRCTSPIDRPTWCRRAAATARVLLPCTSGTATRGSGGAGVEPPPWVSRKTIAITGRIGSAAAHSGTRGVWRNTASNRSARAPGRRGVATISMVWSTARPSRRGRSACTVSAVPARRPGEAGKLGVSMSTLHAPRASAPCTSTMIVSFAELRTISASWALR